MRIYVAGHRGLVGSAIVRAIERNGTHTWVGKTREELDLLDRSAVFNFVKKEKPDWVIIAAAKVGGIQANSRYPVNFLSENLQIETNLLDACHAADIERVLFLGSSCIYPKDCPQPIREEYLLTGPLEPTNEAYALAKISGLKLVSAYRRQYGHSWISAMPTNLYGPGDSYDLENSHVLPAMIRKLHEAKKNGSSSVEMWGTGNPRREFLHADDLAEAALHLLAHYDEEVAINVGTGIDLSIRDLASSISRVVGFEGEITWNANKPDGTLRKLLDVEKLHESGWRHSIELETGVQAVYADLRTMSWY
jgi:GDP-L-fucose synthase